MQKPTEGVRRLPYWIAPALVIAVFVAGLLVLGWMTLFIYSVSAPRGVLKNKTDWPKPIAEMFDDSEIEVYGLTQFLDDRIVAQVYGHHEVIEKLVQSNQLQATDASHPVVPALKQAIPGKWNKWLDSANDQWYATKDFGTVHLEGQDLFLLVTNPESGRTLIYYNWIF